MFSFMTARPHDAVVATFLLHPQKMYEQIFKYLMIVSWSTCDRCVCPSGGGHHARERGQSPGERPEAVGAGRPGRRPAGRSLAVREQRRQTQEQVLVEKLQGGHVFPIMLRSCNIHYSSV